MIVLISVLFSLSAMAQPTAISVIPLQNSSANEQSQTSTKPHSDFKSPNNMKNIVSLTDFLDKIKSNHPVSFDDTIAIIQAHYHYQATEFSNGLGEDRLISAAGVNQGSCKIFAFAQLQKLTIEQTLSLFGDYYREDVLKHPEGADHQNIRNFMKYGWDGISFQNQALSEIQQ